MMLDPFVPYQLLVNQSDWLMRHFPIRCAFSGPEPIGVCSAYIAFSASVIWFFWACICLCNGFDGFIGAIGGVGWFVSNAIYVGDCTAWVRHFSLGLLMQGGFLALAAACFVIFLWKLIFASLTVMAWVVALMAIAYLFMINQHLTDLISDVGVGSLTMLSGFCRQACAMAQVKDMLVAKDGS